MPRYNLYPAAELQGNTLPGYSTGYALAAMEKLAAEHLPDGFGFEWTELAYQEKLVGNTGLLVFAASVVFVFLVLAAQYESWSLPLAVILIVPMCLLAGVSGLLLRGMEVNILAQVGFVVLIGLAAKNAILIIEFARQAEVEGRSRIDAAVQAARTRLRPILMTSFAFILGVVPLAIAVGAGSEMRQVAGHHGVLRHAGRDRLRPDLHAGVLRQHAQSGQSVAASPARCTRGLVSSLSRFRPGEVPAQGAEVLWARKDQFSLLTPPPPQDGDTSPLAGSVWIGEILDRCSETSWTL